MKTLYLDLGMGAAGDMLTAALSELLEDKNDFVDTMNRLGLEGVQFSLEKAEKCGIAGTHARVVVEGEEEISEDVHEHDHEHHHEHEDHHEHEHEHHHEHDHEHHHEHEHDHHDHEHHHHDHDHEHYDHHGHHHHDHDHHHHHHEHMHMEQIRHIVEHMPIEEAVKRDILAVYDILAAGESKAHGKPVEEVHFHEVGAKDAIADITAVCLLMRRIGAEKIRASAVHVGSGKVRCAHGIMPVPAPATAAILENIPIYSTGLEGELCTPTGAALLKYYVQDFGPMPAMAVQKTGYGMGKKDFPVANCVRALLGESTDTEKFAAEGAQTYAVPEGSKAFSQGGKEEHIIGLSCNVDDMTGEEMGYAIEELLAAGAREAYVIPVTMKKSRPGMQLEVYCTEGDRQRMVEKIFALTTTIGIRELVYNRYILDRTEYTQSTTLGEVRVKKSSGYGVVREKAEYEDVKRIAKEQGSSIARVREMIGKEISGDS